LALEAGGELAHRHRDENEQNEIENLLRIPDSETVKRRIEEEGGGEYAANRGNHRGHDAPARGRDHHRDQENHGTVGEPDFIHQGKQQRGEGGDQAERRENAGQFLADAVEFQAVGHCLTGAAAGFR
jgi:hypothetical protein